METHLPVDPFCQSSGRLPPPPPSPPPSHMGGHLPPAAWSPSETSPSPPVAGASLDPKAVLLRRQAPRPSFTGKAGGFGLRMLGPTTSPPTCLGWCCGCPGKTPGASCVP
ncbi:hypothetical protein NL676_035129 [Syzygium grande]|nr:hypothetical protein NL676_035129 [Syzygium grande]